MNAALQSGVTYPDLEQLTETIARAAPGFQAVYAFGTDSLNKANPVVQAVDRWAEEGRVSRHIRKGVGYVIVKCGPKPVGGRAAKPDSGKLARKAAALADRPEGALYRYIKGLAEDGLPFPTCAAIADELGWRDGHQVSYRLGLLEKAGVVTKTRGKAQEVIVTLLAEGIATASVEPVTRHNAREHAAGWRA